MQPVGDKKFFRQSERAPKAAEGWKEVKNRRSRELRPFELRSEAFLSVRAIVGSYRAATLMKISYVEHTHTVTHVHTRRKKISWDSYNFVDRNKLICYGDK